MISRQRTSTIVDTLQQQGLIREAITSYKIPRLADGKNDGELTLGGMNPDKYDPDTLVTVPNVNLLGFWEAEIGAVTVNGNDMGWTNRTAIMDTGTVRLMLRSARQCLLYSTDTSFFSDRRWSSLLQRLVSILLSKIACVC